MDIIEWVLKIVLFVGNAWMAVLLAYNLFLSIFGFKRYTPMYAQQDPQARFLILVPAHNEEAVIADMVQSLSSLDYPKELYDFYIIADNCTDRTAEIARGLGANVIENHKASADAPTGKPIALRKALMEVSDYAERYDLLMIFDADNLMDNNILREVNSQYLSENEPEIIQCYLGSKNHNGIVALFYHMTYTVTNRFMNLSKYRMGWNIPVGGTGFAIQTAYLQQRGGWTTMSLTEDFEMQVDVAINGGRILWNHNVRIYDEKPTNLIASFRQRVRWSQGHWFVALRNTPRLFKVWFQGKLSFGEMLSLFTYMYSMAAPIFMILMLISNMLNLLTPFVYGDALATAMNAAQAAMQAGQVHHQPYRLIIASIPSIAMLLYSFLSLYWWAERVDNGVKVPLYKMPFILFSYFVNLVNVSLAQVVGLLKHRQQSKWVKTQHKIRRRETVKTA